MVIFNLGYVFHDLLLGHWVHEKESAITREAYIIPAIAFILYTIIQSFLLHVFYFYAKPRHHWCIYKTAVIFGALLRFL
jgi:predicted histidine transporter YuiF (NhaC family)